MRDSERVVNEGEGDMVRYARIKGVIGKESDCLTRKDEWDVRKGQGLYTLTFLPNIDVAQTCEGPCTMYAT